MSEHVSESRSVLVVGAANMDIAGGTAHPLTPGDSIPGQIRCAPGGVARNVAENLARLDGARVQLLSVVGDDLFGHSLITHTRAAGVDMDACHRLTDAATSAYLSVHGPDGDMATAVNDMAILERITPALLATHARRLTGAAALVLDANLPEAAFGWLCAQARVHAVPVFVDPVSAFKCRRVAPWLDHVHTLKANRLEAAALWGKPLDDDTAIASSAAWLHAQGVARVVLSLGERGVYFSMRGGQSGWQAGLRLPSVVNATGAGDALLAGIVHGYLQALPLRASVRFATGCAALTLGVPQANAPGLSVAAVQQLLLRAAE